MPSPHPLQYGGSEQSSTAFDTICMRLISNPLPAQMMAFSLLIMVWVRTQHDAEVHAMK